MTTRQRVFTTVCRLLQAHQCHSLSNGSSTHLPGRLSGLLGQSSAASQASSCRSCGLARQARQHLPFNRGFATQPDKQSTAEAAEAAAKQVSRAAAAGTARATAQNAGAGAGAAAGARAGARANAGAAAAAAANSGPPPPLSGFQQWWRSFQRVPPVPKWLALSGVIPFIALSPPVCKHLEPLLPTLVYENCDLAQLMYGVIIVTFLGAVHWGVALATPLTSPIALRMANNAYVYSVLPSLVAWPVATMEPGAGHFCLLMLLAGVYFADLSRANYFPTWYIALRLPVTLMACFGMLLTFTQHYYAEMEKVEKFKQEEEQAAQAAA